LDLGFLSLIKKNTHHQGLNTAMTAHRKTRKEDDIVGCTVHITVRHLNISKLHPTVVFVTSLRVQWCRWAIIERWVLI